VSIVKRPEGDARQHTSEVNRGKHLLETLLKKSGCVQEFGGSGGHAAKTGRRPILSGRDLRYLKRLSDKNSSVEITTKSGLDNSTWTADQILHPEKSNQIPRI
jgi:hypothetical protein